MNGRNRDRGVAENGERLIAGQAAAWLVRMAEKQLPVPERKRFEHWLAEDPAHRAAFDAAAAAWDDLGLLRDDPGPLRAKPSPTRRLAWKAAAALAACLLLAVGLGGYWFGDPVLLVLADYRTAPGELRTVGLPDGSVLEMAPDSAVALHFDDRERRLELLDGTVYVTAVPRETAGDRAFVIAAANGMATALGTRFAVARAADTVTVTVSEHQVAVDVGASRVTLDPGQAVRYDQAGRLTPVYPVDIDRAIAWRAGLLVFDRQPLGEVVATLNRYGRQRIVIADGALAARTVSGVFRAGDTDAALASIAQELRIGILALPPFATLLF